MEEIILLLKAGKIEEALTTLKSTITVDKADIDNLRKEFIDKDRTIRTRQVGNIQKSYPVGTGQNQRIVVPVNIPITLQKKIVTTATAFEFGEPVTLLPNEINELSDEIFRLWRINRIDSKLFKAKFLQKSELQSAILFYIEDQSKKTILNTLLGLNKKLEIKSRLLTNDKGLMYPYFDSYGDMKAFTWEFVTKEKGKDVNNYWVYTDETVYQSNNSTGVFVTTAVKHGFGKIPIVYMTQEKSEWDDVNELIDRLEVSMSKLGDSNDYTGHPILKMYGDVKGAPQKDDSGKAFILETKVLKDGTKITSDVDFLTYDNAPESVKLEIEQLEKFIYSLTSTPDISFDNVKGMGNVSGVALKLLFLDAIIKAKANEPENKTTVERIVNVLMSGVVTTTQTSKKNLATTTFFDVKFNSVIPQDFDTLVKTLAAAHKDGIMSKKKAVEMLDVAEDIEEEVNLINGAQTADNA